MQRGENPVLVGFYYLNMKVSILARLIFCSGFGTTLQGQKTLLAKLSLCFPIETSTRMNGKLIEWCMWIASKVFCKLIFNSLYDQNHGQPLTW